MIIEVDDNTGVAKTFKSLGEFAFSHDSELSKVYEKKFKPGVELNLWNREYLESQLPKDTGKIVRITSHLTYIVCECENGEVYSFNRTGKRPFFEIDIKPWQK